MTFDFYRKTLTDPGVFPLMLEDGDLQWKILLDYDGQRDEFNLSINDQPFHALPYLADLAPSGPQNMTGGYIKLNQVQVTDICSGFNQITSGTVEKWCKLKKLQPTTDIVV